MVFVGSSTFSRPEISQREDPIAQHIGVVLAGGASTRFGSPKGLATVGGVAIVERVLGAIRAVLPRSVVVANEPAEYERFGVPVFPDRLYGQGPLAGIEAGLRWAVGEGGAGIVCVPCDAPFLQPELVRRLVERSPGHTAVLPKSRGPLGYEPLFGWYSVDLVETVTEALEASRGALHDFVSTLPRVAFLSLAEIREFADPDLLFLNVNTRHELDTARRRVAASDDSEG